MPREDPGATAARLDEAERTRSQIHMMGLDHPGMDLRHAYAVQTARAGCKLVAGRGRIGRKVGLTSRAMQTALGTLAAHGEALEAGEVVLCSSFIRPMEVGTGDTVHADRGRLGTVSCRFA